MQEKLRCAIYTRVSTDTQTDVELSSCEAYEEKIRAFVKSQMGIYEYTFNNLICNSRKHSLLDQTSSPC